MANHVHNSITFSGVRPEDMDKLLDAIQYWKLCQTYYPEEDEVRADIVCWELRDWMITKLQSLKAEWYDVEKRWNKIDQFFPTRDLRYNWRCNHWWSKRDIFDTCINTHDETSVDFICETAWTPVLWALKKISEILHCTIDVAYDEEWNWFSWKRTVKDWKVINDQRYDDAFYWDWVQCEECWGIYDINDWDSWHELADYHWWSGKRDICSNCWEFMKDDDSESLEK